ncbi:RNA-directed DNA polymerase, eukaryota, reverse transcriptase zinc-binding domain protein [Tanacetum coccineum]
MPIDSNKPPDPLFDEFCELTKMTSAEEICNASFNDTKVKFVKGKHRKPFRGIKISTPGSAGAGSILRRLRSAKVSGKARDRVEGSSVDSRGGKRVSSSHLNNEIKEVLADLNSGKLNNNLKFSMGCSSDVLNFVCSLNSEVEANNVSNGNDGSFIKAPLNPSPCSNRENSPVAKSYGLKTSLDSTSMGDVGSTVCGLASSKDGITIAETGLLNEKGMAGPSVMSNLASMDDVVSAGIGSHSPMDGIACDKDGAKFEFGKIFGSKGILNKPNKPMFTVNFGSNVRTGYLFSSKPVGSPSLNAWGANEGIIFGHTILSNQNSADAERQKFKIEWLSEGDCNSKYFHNVVKGRINRGRIFVVEDMYGIPHFGSSVSDDIYMIRDISDNEIKAALFDIDSNKAPGHDGYSSQFFKDAWNVIVKEFFKAVRDFFISGKLLKEVNSTVISLVPKISTPRRVSNYRPIACCNVVYKCISKILVNRIKGCLDSLVDQNQSAFIPSRQISDNVLLSQELLRGYHRKRGYARCAFKVDIQKAYDSVEWSFLRDCLNRFGFHSTMIKWIMECITSTSFSINVNGDLRGFFKGKRGLRQGDPLSSYLFTLIMEVLNLIIKRNIVANPHFKYHWKCKDLKITHLCFADDLMLFCHDDSKSVSVLKNSLNEFGSVSGLFPSFPKSTMFFGNVRETCRTKILEVMPFIEGKLPIRHLGVPLLSKRLYVNDCFVLVDKVKKRILDWKNKLLSFDGRLQLILSVVGSMQVYWSSMFILPITISNEVERLMRDFLWNYGDFKRGKARIKWVDVCKSKVEGGLGIKSLESWNIALISKHIWNIINKKDSIIGNGLDMSLWFDNWHAICPLSEFISKSNIYYSGLSLDCKVANVIENGMWKWPRGLSMKFDGLNAIEPPCLTEGKKDKVFWKTVSGRLKIFFVNTVWNDLRVCSKTVPWAKLVLFSQCIPTHAFMVWLVIHGRLKTQDLMGIWEKNDDMRCVFCKKFPDSHDHLFFECEFSKKERNVRIFQDKSRSVEALTCLIKDTVRLRIMSVSLNDSTQVFEAASLWNFHVDRGIEDAGLIMKPMNCVTYFGSVFPSSARWVFSFGLQAHVKKTD